MLYIHLLIQMSDSGDKKQTYDNKISLKIKTSKKKKKNRILNFYISIILPKKSMIKGFTLVKEAGYRAEGRTERDLETK